MWAVHCAAPALKVTFTGTPGLDFARGDRGRAATADTRARSRGHVRAHAVWFQGAPPPQTDGIGGSTPSAPLLGELLGLGAVTLAAQPPYGSLVLDVPVRQSCSTVSEAQFGAAQTWTMGRAQVGVCVLWGEMLGC